jgi:mono/diheme cytochrome c family protein
MTQRKHTIGLPLAIGVVAVLLSSCKGDPNSPGVEYMPDMYRSPAIEAYVDFGQDPYHYSEDLAREQRNRPSARKPAEGTIPFAEDAAKAQFRMPYPYPNTNDGYEQAGRELKNPIVMTEATVDQGKEIYGKYCLHCHGEKGQGDGAVVQRSNDKYPQPPAYDGAQLQDLPEGKMYHTITYGKGAMGSHASQLNKEERWLVVHYVKYLQAGGKMPGAAKEEATAAN